MIQIDKHHFPVEIQNIFAELAKETGFNIDDYHCVSAL